MNSRIRIVGLLLTSIVASPVWGQTTQTEVPTEATEKVKQGNALYDQGKYAEAVKRYESAVSLAPNWYEPHYELGQTFYQMKQPDDAQREFALALEREPNCWLCHQGLGNMADDLGNREAAMTHYQKAVSLAPDRGQPRYNLAITYVRLKRIDDAITSLKECEKVEPDYASPYFLLGNLYYGQKKYYLAFDQLFQATKLEKSGARFDKAKKLIDVHVTVDQKLDGNSMGNHMSYCLARAGSISPEEYRKRFPGAETYADNFPEEQYVFDTFATILSEFPKKRTAGTEFQSLITVKKAGFLGPYILVSSGDRFKNDLEEYESKNPGQIAEFRKWASANKISLEPIHPRCEVQWMGETW